MLWTPELSVDLISHLACRKILTNFLNVYSLTTKTGTSWVVRVVIVAVRGSGYSSTRYPGSRKLNLKSCYYFQNEELVI